jgi:hypothetical protein
MQLLLEKHVLFSYASSPYGVPPERQEREKALAWELCGHEERSEDLRERERER